ncbi:MAG: DNA-3-methyladenine glycosylase [Bdellovibrionales bacterium]|nr:DNA-3-methyladenine glycosylase [Bdellovibrionales bacterium]
MFKLRKNFFTRETTKVATDLLNCVLVRVTETSAVLKGRIVETEAYLGLKDDSCHSFGGRKTKRTQVMYLPGGYAYIYFTYGMHYCFNIVTAGRREPEAVLIRALEPIEGISEMQENRLKKDIKNLTRGPGRLCQALNISKNLNGADMEGSRLYVEKGNFMSLERIAVSERIGLSPFRLSRYWPLRFYIKDNPFVSIY